MYTKINDPTQGKNIHRVLEAFEKDFNFVNNAPTAAFLFEKNKKLGNAYEQFAKTLGPEKANKFLNEFERKNNFFQIFQLGTLKKSFLSYKLKI